MAANKDSLKDALAATVPENFRCKVRYIHTPPKPCDPLFSPPPGHESEKTRLASHFFGISVAGTSSRDNGALTSNEDHTDVLALGIEVLVYTTTHLTTIFVSKADSTGFMPQSPHATSVKPMVVTVLQWLTNQECRKKPERKVVVSLFARAQSQYLFPGSAENSRKHVLDDRQLIKWWAKVLDPILTQASDGDESEAPAIQGYITVPGFEGSELRQFYPAQGHAVSGRPRWQAGNPLLKLAETRGISAETQPRCLLPRFPDDPKARFMQDLDDEVGIAENSATTSPTKRKRGKWNTIRDLDRFWEAMEFRQECSSGRMVGFLWVVIPPRHGATNGIMNGESQESSQGAPTSAPASQRDVTPTPATNSSPKKKRTRKLLTGPIMARKPRLKGGSSSLSATSAGLSGMIDGARSSEEGLLLTQEGYDQAMHTLLHLDFANMDVAVISTRKWVNEVSSICGLASEFGVDVIGTARPAESASKAGANGNGNGQVNDLGGMVRRKRKAGDSPGAEGPVVADARVETKASEVPAVNVLAAGMVRKKPKPAAK